MGRISTAFEKAKKERRAAFVPYLTAGLPNEKDFVNVALGLLEYGDVLEVGLPYSDPLGDGPVVQRASEKVLQQGMTTLKAFDLIRELRKHTDKALVMMTYYNPIYCYRKGEAGFLEDLKNAGADGVILPDLIPDEAETLLPKARQLDLDTIFLVAPTSTDERLKFVTSHCRGFIYAISVTGVTGERDKLPEAPELVKRIKTFSGLPVAVGFGVSNGKTAKLVAEIADGVVVGSALIRAVEENKDVQGLAKEIAKACGKGILV
ncbi:MAG: tryptophan synthase subunit alpha [Trueperaceae bacterium]